ncbi:TPA: K(+)-transporting ATPase subunit F [Pseudomonas aeruginosa]|uniref:K(+)-transporting ATPase subunit F n=1 Tax=Pseudomonas aeruginosa TaxID=287 RepID=UPI001872CA66
MPSDTALNRFFTPPLRRLSLKRQRPLEGEIAHMTVLDWLSLATGLFVYLLVALLRADRA